ncbi:hypothetical protein ABMB44_05685 [Levilactobacillus brevis]|uniref:Uncharacterized protein n=1 Tax=Levilactobacillus brevis TaxID=1580 RepID=A0A2A3TXJ8_LEVBR|nr:hypothetical protein [Levilactobacillus brevis]PBQ23824.1 hypothetical protein CNR29_07265 [Levilactobacillus brevis]HJE00094.1 hypothetical protein [Levilactobacillus brevis]
MTLLVGGNEVTKVMLGSNVLFDKTAAWHDYPNIDEEVTGGALVYKWLTPTSFQIMGMLQTKSHSFRIAPPDGYKFVRTNSTSASVGWTGSAATGNSILIFMHLSVDSKGSMLSMVDSNGSLSGSSFLYIGVDNPVTVTVEKLEE